MSVAVAPILRTAPKRPTYGTHPDLPGVVLELRQVTPVLAGDWLGVNTDNRKEKKRQTEGIERDLEGERFEFNGATIVFYEPEDGQPPVLADGQHRLAAIVKTGRSEILAVAWGVKRRAKRTIDCGKSRNAADVFTMDHVPYATDVQALARRVHNWTLTTERGAPGSGRTSPTTPEIEDAFKAHPEILDYAKWAVSARSRGTGLGLRTSALGIVRWVLMRDSDQGAVEWFMDRVVDGAELPKGHPVLYLRDKLTRHTRPHAERLTEADQTAFLFLCWNAIMTGDQRERYNRSPGGESFANKMPVPVTVDGEWWRGLISAAPVPVPGGVVPAPRAELAVPADHA